jgi:starvation-inducible outer membrane lipoprotein
MMCKLIFIAVVALALTGCATAPVMVAPPQSIQPMLRDVMPASLLVCHAEPLGAGISTNRQAAKYVLDLKSAGQDCRAKLRAVGGLIRNEGE